jgi:hypothetical protein
MAARKSQLKSGVTQDSMYLTISRADDDRKVNWHTRFVCEQGDKLLPASCCKPVLCCRLQTGLTMCLASHRSIHHITKDYMSVMTPTFKRMRACTVPGGSPSPVDAVTPRYKSGESMSHRPFQTIH